MPHVVSSLVASRPRLRRALIAVVIAVAAGAVMIGLTARGDHGAPPVATVPGPPVCVLPVSVDTPEPEPEPPLVEPPALPDEGSWDGLARCLAAPGFRVHVTVAQVRHWVEVAHLPAWREDGGWWLPLSGEGRPDFPSGAYVHVPTGGAPCGWAVMN